MFDGTAGMVETLVWTILHEKRPKQTFLQRRHKDGQQTHEKMLNIAHYSVQSLSHVLLLATP